MRDAPKHTSTAATGASPEEYSGVKQQAQVPISFRRCRLTLTITYEDHLYHIPSGSLSTYFAQANDNKVLFIFRKIILVGHREKSALKVNFGQKTRVSPGLGEVTTKTLWRRRRPQYRLQRRCDAPAAWLHMQHTPQPYRSQRGGR
jgi:hypothetical protein